MSNLPDPPRDPWIERRVNELVLEQRVATVLLAATIAQAERKLLALTFPLDFPVPGWDVETIVSQLREFRPIEAIDAWQRQARELIQSGET